MRYTVVYEQTPRNWSAYVPDLPGCIAAAKTRRGTERLIRGAIEMYVESTLESGDPIPQPGVWTSTVDVELPAGDALSARAGVTRDLRGPKRASA
jgi:predicted RNase H-like HicB family nuclease